MAEAEERTIIGVMVDGPSGQRLVERLSRSGAAAEAVFPELFAHAAEAGRLYLAPMGQLALAEVATRQGAHVCLMPPWPAEPATIGATSVGITEVERRGPARCTVALRNSTAAQGDAWRPLKILYRERLAGAFGTVLVESEAGEAVLATLQRTSSRHGYLLVTTLQLAVASAQTRIEDVGRLVDRLTEWCASHAEPGAPAAQKRGEPARQPGPGEAVAPVVMLALTLCRQQAERGPQAGPQGNNSVETACVRTRFEQTCRVLDLPVEPGAFDRGWGWLEAHGVVSPVEGDLARVDVTASDHYSALWQLAPRARRLRHAIGGSVGGDVAPAGDEG